jgi:hypothetical protein
MTSATKCIPANRNGIRIKSRIKAGGLWQNHNQAACGVRIKSRVKAGRLAANHNQTTARCRA